MAKKKSTKRNNNKAEMDEDELPVDFDQPSPTVAVRSKGGNRFDALAPETEVSRYRSCDVLLRSLTSCNERERK